MKESRSLFERRYFCMDVHCAVWFVCVSSTPEKWKRNSVILNSLRNEDVRLHSAHSKSNGRQRINHGSVISDCESIETGILKLQYLSVIAPLIASESEPVTRIFIQWPAEFRQKPKLGILKLKYFPRLARFISSERKNGTVKQAYFVYYCSPDSGKSDAGILKLESPNYSSCFTRRKD